jgi:hypothetical protein
MMNVGALQAHIMEYRRKPWIGDSVNHIVRDTGSIAEPIVKAHAVILERGSREHADGSWKFAFVLQGWTDPTPRRSFALWSGAKHVQLD